MIKEITTRRSIRKYAATPVPRAVLEEIIEAGILAPSSKNRQPWHFIVVTGAAKAEMVTVMGLGLDREAQTPLLPESAPYLAGARQTRDIMNQAGAVIFVVNTLGFEIHQPLETEDRISEICNVQSIGAAIENMTLTATSLGYGSLWICDFYFAYGELRNWLETDGELVAALAVGVAAEEPAPRPRRTLAACTVWRDK